MKWKDIKTIKKLKKQANETLSRKVPYDQEGNIVLKLSEKDVNKSFEIDSDDDSGSLTSAFKDYLISFRDSFAAEPVSVVLDKKLPPQKKEKFFTLYQSFFRYRILDVERELKMNRFAYLILMVMGIVVIIAGILCTFYGEKWGAAGGPVVNGGGNKVSSLNVLTVLGKIIDILAWVFLWESFDKFFFVRTKLRREQFKNLHMYSAKFHEGDVIIDIKEVTVKDKSNLNKY